MVARARKAVFPPAPEVVSGVQFPKTSERGDRSTTAAGEAQRPAAVTIFERC